MTVAVAAAIGWALVLGVVGGALTEIGPWYRALRKPSFQPPDWLFGPAWTVILGMAAYAAVLAWDGAPDAASRTEVAVLFAINGALHLLWSPLFFKARRPDWALAEVVALWLSVLALVVGLAAFSTTASLLVAPYFAWVSFAAVLNLTIVRLNAPFGRP